MRSNFKMRSAEASKKGSNTKQKIDIKPYLNEIADILNIEIPAIKSVACLYNNPQKNRIEAQLDLNISEIPANASFNGAYVPDDRPIIYIAEKIPVVTPNNSLFFANLSDGERLFLLTHELRHIWQKKYHNDMYGYNAVNTETITDISEIDADAFALSYVFSEKTPFTANDISNIQSELCLQATADKGARWERAKELSDEYKFGNFEKVMDVKTSTDQKTVNDAMKILKLKGLI